MFRILNSIFTDRKQSTGIALRKGTDIAYEGGRDVSVQEFLDIASNVSVTKLERVDVDSNPPIIDPPADVEILEALRGIGIKRIYGLFDKVAWSNTIMHADLYTMPLADSANAYIAPIHNYAHELRARSSFMDGRDSHKRAFNKFRKEGKLLTTLFPNYKEAEARFGSVGIAYPKPPKAELEAVQRASLAGFNVRAAVPEPALSVTYRTHVSPMAYAVDPILFGKRDGDQKVVVLGYYNMSSSDSDEVKSLVALLESMKRDI